MSVPNKSRVYMVRNKEDMSTGKEISDYAVGASSSQEHPNTQTNAGNNLAFHSNAALQ